MGRNQMLKQIGFALCCVLGAAIYIGITPEAFAQSSLGVGRSEQAIKPEGMFAGILFWIQQQQQSFYKAMTTALKTIRDDGNAFWYLTGLSFAYGVFHAAGPGHGKAVISSYMLANEVAAKRGIMLSFASALLQGITAVVVIGAIMLFLRGTGIKTSNLAGTLEITSYFLVMMLGLYLIWTKVFKGRAIKAHAHTHDYHHTHEHAHAHDHDHLHSHAPHPDPHHVHGPECGCGHSHAADPKLLEGKTLGTKEAISAIFAVGLRPCSGAIIVLTFAFLNGLYAAGIASTFAMSIGTGITVATLALLAVSAKNVAIRVSGAQDSLATIHRVIEISGALLVFVLGFLLFSAAMSV